MPTCDVNDSSVDEYPFNITLDIEGKIFRTSETTTKSIPGSLLAGLNKESQYFNAATNAYCFDRDSNLFPHILRAHRDGEVHIPKDVCAIQFRRELEFWKIPKSLIAPCCWSYFYSSYDELDILNTIIKSLPKSAEFKPDKIRLLLSSKQDKEIPLAGVPADPDKDDVTTWRHKLWLFLEEPQSSRPAKIWAFFFIFMAALSVVLNIIWLEKTVRVDPYLKPYKQHGNTTFNDKMNRLLLTDPHEVLLALDCFCTLFFALEVCVLFAVWPTKRNYFSDWFRNMKTFLAICMVYGTVFEIRKDWLANDDVALAWFLIKSMNTLRAIMLLKIYRLSSTLNVLMLCFQSIQKDCGLLLLILFITVVFYGGLIFAFEMDSDMFPDTTRSMWWALITMTTIGYGDFHPTKPMGYIVGAVCAVDGIMTIALPVALVASRFSKYKDRDDDLHRYLEAVKEEEVDSNDNGTVQDISVENEIDKNVETEPL